MGIIAATVITVVTCGVGTPLGAVVATAAITTGATMTYAAATDSVMVMDVSLSTPLGPAYAKAGESIIFDFREGGGIYSYNHKGGGVGKSYGVSYSVGMVYNFDNPEDYSRQFYDFSYCNYIGIDKCTASLQDTSATQARCATFGNGLSTGVGYDYYSDPRVLIRWGKE